jgi:signal transduction histidine kinase
VDAADRVTEADGRVTVTLRKALPRKLHMDADTGEQLHVVLLDTVKHSPMDELRSQNAELAGALAELQHRQRELLQLNAELEETNRGVMALYNQLSTELEETNRGVVALYAELDERGVQLHQANEAKTRFLRNVSHELRTPVNSILGLARLLLDPTADAMTAEQQHQVRLVHSSAEDLLTLVNGLLDLSRAESGRIDPVFTEIDLGVLFDQLEGTTQALIGHDGVQVVVEPPQPDARRLHTDESLLRQVLRNLLGNAVKFTTKGEIRLRAERHDAAIRITVADTGVGVAAEDQPRIFEEFFQVRGPLQAAVTGTGLGLAYVHRVVRLMGGDIRLTSAVGEGSAFTVVLPDRAGDTSVASDGAAAVRVPVVLLVADDPAAREMLRDLVAPYAERVVEATDGAHALTVLRQQTPNVVFLDLGMSGMDGAAVLTVMAEDEVLRTVPVVVVSGAERESRVDSDRLGPAAAVLPKSSLTPEEVAATLARVLRRAT